MSQMGSLFPCFITLCFWLWGSGGWLVPMVPSPLPQDTHCSICLCLLSGAPGEGVILDYSLMENYCIQVAWYTITVAIVSVPRPVMSAYPCRLLSSFWLTAQVSSFPAIPYSLMVNWLQFLPPSSRILYKRRLLHLAGLT